MLCLFFFLILPPPRSPLFPYTTLFRSSPTGRRASRGPEDVLDVGTGRAASGGVVVVERAAGGGRSEEHTSELQSLRHLVCRLLLEKKKMDITLHVVRRPQPRSLHRKYM